MRERTDWLTKGVRGIGAASLLSDLGHEVPTALLPRFLTSDARGLRQRRSGSSRDWRTGSPGSRRFVGGALADDPDRRRAIAVGGYTATAVLSGAIGRRQPSGRSAVLRAGGLGGARAPGPVAQRAARGRRAGRGLRARLRLRADDGQPRGDRRAAARARRWSPRSGCGPRSCSRSSPGCSRRWRSSTRSGICRACSAASASRSGSRSGRCSEAGSAG